MKRSEGMGVFSMTSPRARPTRLEARSGLARGAARFRPPHIPDELRNNQEMLQSIFPVVVFGAVALSVVMSVVFLVSRGSVYDQIGQGGMSRDSEASDLVSVSAPSVSSAAGRAEQEREIRQMLSARSERLVK